MRKNLERVFAAAVEGDFVTMEQEIRAFTEDFDSRPQLRYMGAQRAADAGHPEKATELVKTLTVSEGDKCLAHLNMAAKYIAGEDKLPFDLLLIETGKEGRIVQRQADQFLIFLRLKVRWIHLIIIISTICSTHIIMVAAAVAAACR